MKPRILFLITLLCAAIAVLQSVNAATITVINTNDSDTGSLRQALADASNGDTINFSVTGTITLTTGQLGVSSSVTISGPGTNQLTVQRSTDLGTPDFRIFYISSGKTVTISGLTIIYGQPSGSFPNDSGGGIYNDHATLTVGNCTLTGNSATWGGGIYNFGENNGSAALTVSNSIVSGNSSGNSGGGIYNDGENHGSATLVISNSMLSSNSAAGTGAGGGIYNDGLFAGNAALTVNNSTLNSNSAPYGAGIYNTAFPAPPSDPGSVTVAISNSTLSSNSATTSGGGIYNSSESISPVTVTISNSTLSGNSASVSGGGIYNEAVDHVAIGPGSATLTISNSTLSSNSASTSGGGIYNHVLGGTARVTITNSTLSGNSASSFGGGIHNFGEIFGDATVTIGETILNAGASGANIDNFSGAVTSLGYNLSSDDASAVLNATGDQNSTSPLLGPLQNNGGPTFTHLPLSNSPAIDAGDPNMLTDQRGPGFLRLVNNRIDIGAVEVQATPTPTPTPTATPHHTPPPHPTPRPH